MFNMKATKGISLIEELLEMNEIEYAYVSNSNTIHISRDYIVPKGMPICYIRNSGTGSYMLEISRQDEDFKIEYEYSVRINTSLEDAQRAQTLVNSYLLKRDYHESGISFDLDGHRYEAGKLYNVYVKVWKLNLIDLERKAKLLNFNFESDGHKMLSFKNLTTLNILRLHNRLCKPNESMIWLDSVVE